MIDNLIIINGGEYNDIKKALMQWINLYANVVDEGLKFELYKNGIGNHIIKADQSLENDMFYFLVNYLYYPERIGYKADIKGFTKGKDKNVLQNKELMVYMSPTDTDGDNVFVATSENVNFKFDFGGKITKTKESKVYALPTDLKFENPETIKVSKAELEKLNINRGHNRVNKRFSILSRIAYGLFLLIILIPSLINNNELLFTASLFFGFGTAFWFFIDYEILRKDNMYLQCVLLAMIHLVYEVIIFFLFKDVHRDFISFGSLHPLVLLVMQKPLRFLYVKMFKREPVTNNEEKLADKAYSLILFISAIIIPVLIVMQLKI